MRFKDVFSIIGPAMVGPSSSHTAGAVRIGRIAYHLFGKGIPELAEITFYGSFAETYQGHGTDLAIVAGLMDFDTDDLRIPSSLSHAESAGMEIRFIKGKNRMAHPNTARLKLSGGGHQSSLIGCSIGGGNVEIVSVNEFDVKFTGAYPTLVIFHEDRPGMIAETTALLHQNHVNIGHMDVDRKGRLGEAITVLELDSAISTNLVASIRALAGVRDTKVIDLNAKRGNAK